MEEKPIEQSQSNPSPVRDIRSGITAVCINLLAIFVAISLIGIIIICIVSGVQLLPGSIRDGARMIFGGIILGLIFLTFDMAIMRNNKAFKATTVCITLLSIFVMICVITMIIAGIVFGVKMFPERIGAGLGMIFGGIILGLALPAFSLRFMEKYYRSGNKLFETISSVVYGLLYISVIISIIALVIAGTNSWLDNLFVSIILGLVAFVFCVCMFWIAIFKIMGISILGERRKKRDKKKHP